MTKEFYLYIQATQEELKASYRRLCMLYHPDKHRDPELKRQAEQLFNFVHKAYEGTYKVFLLKPLTNLLCLGYCFLLFYLSYFKQ